MSRYWQQLRTLLWKELLVEARTRDATLAGTTFALLVLVIFDFALDLHSVDAPTMAPGILWVAITFAGVISLGRAFNRETDRQTLDGLLLAPMDRSALYLAKLVATYVSMVLVEVVAVPASVVLYGLRLDLPSFSAALLLGTLGIAAVGTLFAAVAARTRARDLLLPLLLFPAQVPVLLATVKATGAAIQGGDSANTSNWIGLLVAFDALFLALSVVLFDFAVEQD